MPPLSPREPLLSNRFSNVARLLLLQGRNSLTALCKIFKPAMGQPGNRLSESTKTDG